MNDPAVANHSAGHQQDLLRAEESLPRPRIFQVTAAAQTLYSFMGGHLRLLRDSGFETHTVATPHEKSDKFAAETGATPHGIPIARPIAPLADMVALCRLVALFLRWRPTLVHAHMPKGGLLGMIAAWLTRVPLRVYTIHGLVYLTRTGWRLKLLRFTERISCRLAHRVLAVSPSLRELIISEKVCPADKIIVINHGSICGVDAEVFDPTPENRAAARTVLREHGIPDDAPVLGFVGRIVHDKGVSVLIDAWRELRDAFPTLHLLLVGEFEDHQPLEPALLRSIQDDPRVHVTGWQDNPAPCVAAMTVMALPSFREGFGLALIEAAAMEVATVASRIPGCVDAVVEDETGLLVDPHDPPALAAAVRSLLNDEPLRKRLGEAGRRRALSCFRPSDIYAGHLSEYLNLMDVRGIEYPIDSLAENSPTPRSAATLLVALERRFLEVNQQIYTDGTYGYYFWREYLDVFDDVVAIARVAHARDVPDGWVRSDGPNVRFHPVFDYLGFWQFLWHLPRVYRDCRAAMRVPGAILLRMGNVAQLCWLARRSGRPYAFEGLGHAGESAARVQNVRRLGLGRIIGALEHRVCRRVAAGADRANYISRYVQRLYPTRSGREWVITDVNLPDDAFGTARTADSFQCNPLRLVTVGRLEPEKGYRFLLEAIADLSRRGRHVCCDFVGSGRLLEELSQMARRLEIADRVRFHGQIEPGPSVQAILRQADLFILPSLTEGLGRALLEAMALGLPAIGSDTGGIPELLNGDSLVPAENAGALAEAINRAGSDPKTLAAMSVANIAVAQGFRSSDLRRRRCEFWTALRKDCRPRETARPDIAR